ncbi:energy transducer TonB [Winogradskyella sp. PG-2]|uniref:energy transducer TonB n=1 Tax=Winogradskyella sp. PG-2 TaxID=754409 RepID=UPI0004585D88|nr:energy transducer TonB [Winogradskyella sp. PG-2]BAO75122.1 TonB family protein [Winogradskyella sp. PG-2]
MKNSKKVFGNAGQSTTEVKKPHKHDANLQKNSTLYFQIGLILCLLGTYSLFEMQFQDKRLIVPEEEAQLVPVSIDYVKPYIVEVIQPKKVESLPSTDVKDVLKVVEDDIPIEERIINTPVDPAPQKDPAPINAIFDCGEDPIDDDFVVPFRSIQVVPVYPGCERKKTNEERKKCMSEKITKLVNRKFNSGIASDHGITGLQRIYTQFTVDKNGNVTDIKIRGPHPALEREAKRVINKIPDMKPGLQRNVPVGVIYTLPIKFEVRD